MNLQLDMFAAGETHTFPPWLDPEICAGFDTVLRSDHDHVGENAVGRVGNNEECVVVRALTRDGQVLKAWRFPERQYLAAQTLMCDLSAELQNNRQAKLL